MKLLTKDYSFITILGGLVIICFSFNVFSIIKGKDWSVDVKTGKDYVSSEQCNDAHITTNEKIIFILAYYRSGSSFTGSIFQHYPGTFYLFEPIRKVYHMYQNGFDSRSHKITYINGDVRRVNHSNGLQVIYEEIDNWLKCNIRGISIESLLDNRKLISTFKECIFTSSADLFGQKMIECINAISNSCRTAKIKVIKFIRLRVKHSLVLLNRYQNIKIIHLVRDPRGIFNSRFKIGPTQQQLFTLLAQKHCSEVAEDIFFSSQIFKKCPSKVRIITFEDIAEIPEATKLMFNFTGMHFSSDISNYLKKQTNADSDSGQYGLSRQNANLTINVWRNSLDLRTANQLYIYCRKSNVFLGYLPLSTLQSLRNYSVPSRKSSLHMREILL